LEIDDHVIALAAVVPVKPHHDVVRGRRELLQYNLLARYFSNVYRLLCAWICTNTNKALVKSSRAFTVPSIGLRNAELALAFARLRTGELQ
jgi:hypothetical protein